MEKPIAYKGDQPYIFVSYAHRDSALVWPIIHRMQQDGYRVWYDDGIIPVVEWDEDIASRIKNCGFFLAFLSENYLASENCKDEIKYARDLTLDRLLVYFSPITLPDEMQMRMGRLQAIHWHAYSDLERAFEKLYEAKGIQAFRTLSATDAQEPPFDAVEDLYQQGLYFQTQGQDRTAFNHFFAAAQQGHPLAQLEVGNCCRSGRGTAGDSAAAAEWYKKAATGGNAAGQFLLGCCYRDGDGVTQDHAEAVKWLSQAANQGHASAQLVLGRCYSRGQGVDRDLADAAYWYKRAAKQGDVDGQYAMGHICQYGLGVKYSRKAALQWYEAAAKQGHADAQYTLGEQYSTRMVKDYDKAFHWFSQAAQQGHAWAKYDLARCYLYGFGTATDKAKAKALFLQTARDSSLLLRIQSRVMLAVWFFTFKLP